MHHLAVKSNLVDSDSRVEKLGSGKNYLQPVCPKPQRIGPPIPEFLEPLRCTKHRFPFFMLFCRFLYSLSPKHCSLIAREIHFCCFFWKTSQANADGRSGILNMITEKV